MSAFNISNELHYDWRQHQDTKCPQLWRENSTLRGTLNAALQCCCAGGLNGGRGGRVGGRGKNERPLPQPYPRTLMDFNQTFHRFTELIPSQNTFKLKLLETKQKYWFIFLRKMLNIVKIC